MDVFIKDAESLLNTLVVPKINQELAKYDISLKYVHCDEDDFDGDAGKILLSIQNDAAVYPFSINIPAVFRFLAETGMDNDPEARIAQLSGTAWHEAGHAICDHFDIYGTYSGLPDEEELAEDYSDYQMRSFTGVNVSILKDIADRQVDNRT